MLETVGTFFVGTIIPCLPALVALVAWGEAGSRILRQFGARMLWEISGLVAVAVAILLYAMLSLMPDEGANIFVIVVASICAVLAVTTVTYRLEGRSARVRTLVSGGASLLALEGGLGLGVFVYMLLWGART